MVIDGRELYYIESRPAGARATLPLLHGAGGSHLVWPEPIRNLKRVRVLALDLPAHGQPGGSGRRSAAGLVAQQGFAAAMPEAAEGVRRQLLATGAMTCFGDFLACDRFDFRHNLTAIATPALVIAGDEDRLTPPRFSQSLAAGLAHGRLVILEGAGHFAMLEQPEEAARLMDEFIGSL